MCFGHLQEVANCFKSQLQITTKCLNNKITYKRNVFGKSKVTSHEQQTKPSGNVPKH